MDRKKNRWKYGIWSAFVTILGVLLAVILVWVAERATERFGLKFDLTANDRYAISEQSVSWLKKLDQFKTQKYCTYFKTSVFNVGACYLHMGKQLFGKRIYCAYYAVSYYFYRKNIV